MDNLDCCRVTCGCRSNYSWLKDGRHLKSLQLLNLVVKSMATPVVNRTKTNVCEHWLTWFRYPGKWIKMHMSIKLSPTAGPFWIMCMTSAIFVLATLRMKAWSSHLICHGIETSTSISISMSVSLLTVVFPVLLLVYHDNKPERWLR